MFKTKENTTPVLKKSNHKYPTNFSNNNLLIPYSKLKTSQFCISVRGPTLWNSLLNNKTKHLTLLARFQKTIKSELINKENEISFFSRYNNIQ